MWRTVKDDYTQGFRQNAGPLVANRRRHHTGKLAACDVRTMEELRSVFSTNRAARRGTLNRMEKIRIEAELPAALAAQARAFVAEGCASDLDELLAEALRRFLDSHTSELTEAFMKEDVQWGLHGDD